MLTETTVPCLRSIILIFLSLHVVANRLPSRFQEMEKMVSVWTAITRMHSALSVFHRIHCQIQIKLARAKKLILWGHVPIRFNPLSNAQPVKMGRLQLQSKDYEER